MQLRWSEAAANDRENITDYLFEHVPEHAPDPHLHCDDLTEGQFAIGWSPPNIAVNGRTRSQRTAVELETIGYLELAIQAIRIIAIQLMKISCRTLSPLTGSIVHLTGDYVWRQHWRVEKGKFRPHATVFAGLVHSAPQSWQYAAHRRRSMNCLARDSGWTRKASPTGT